MAQMTAWVKKWLCPNCRGAYITFVGFIYMCPKCRYKP